MTYKEVCCMRKTAFRLPINIPRSLMRVNRLAQAKATGNFMGNKLRGRLTISKPVNTVKPAKGSWFSRALPWIGLGGAGMALGSYLTGPAEDVNADQYKETPTAVYTPDVDQSVIQKMRYMSSPYKHSFPAQRYAPAKNSIRQKQEMYS